MKKLLLILLCLPLFIFSQEERKYEKTMSFSQFAKELKQAADKGDGYTLESCYITYDAIRDKKYIKVNHEGEFEGDMKIKGLRFNTGSKINITDCKFGAPGQGFYPTITFQDCYFGTLKMVNNDVIQVAINSSNIGNLEIDNFVFDLGKEQTEMKRTKAIEKAIQERSNQASTWPSFKVTIINSKIEKITCSGSYKKEFTMNSSYFSLDSSYVKSVSCFRFHDVKLQYNTLRKVGLWGESLDYDISNNTFTSSSIIKKIIIKDNKATAYSPAFGIYVRGNVNKLDINNNIINNVRQNNDSIFNSLLSYYNKKGKVTKRGYNPENWNDRTGTYQRFDDFINITNDSLEIETGIFYHDSLNFNQKFQFLKKYIKENNINIVKDDDSRYGSISIYSWAYDPTGPTDIKTLLIKNNKIDILRIKSTNISQSLEIIRNKVDSISLFSENTLPDYTRIKLDTSLITKLGFFHDEKISYGDFLFGNLDSTQIESYKSNTSDLITQYRQLISIFNLKGSDQKETLVVKLKDIQTNQKMFEYYEDPNMNTWFNWKGSEFLKWYSDYGMNPFKALTYCFWAMLFFAMFYFIFYNDWDKINRGFLIKRFNSVMDYFTTEKRIEDFYSSEHDKEMTTFTDFKDTLDKNKVYMPSMLASLAKPIYQISLLRYKLLNFSYKKAEFMAGRKWVDLKKKDRYLIGTLTFFLTLTYIIYLISIRALNSIVLSINAFSTLGFGQIPVRGFTKYVAIIEGFIGWFMLSVFIVSLLSQMMSV